MARRESVAIGGFYPTPDEVTRRVVGLLRAPEPDRNRISGGPSVFDPCAGEGAAVKVVADRLRASSVRAVEMEGSRFEALRRAIGWGHEALSGDFFHLEASEGFADLLWLNPPYDTDREFKRLEERFLRRASLYLAPDGVLVYIVPGYALAASAATLAAEYSDLRCWRFPDAEYEAYKQVVLVGRRAHRALGVDAGVVQRVDRWSREPEALPVLPESPVADVTVPTGGHRPTVWKMHPFDLAAVKDGYHPWVSERGEVRDVCPPIDLAARFHRTYPVASTPRASHLAAALAAGVFNGAQVTPNSAGSPLPPLLVKGVFDREYRTVEEKVNAKGEKVAEVQVQQPVLQVTVLDLRGGTFHTVKPSTDLPILDSVEGMTLANLIDDYGESLMRAMLRACPVLHDPRRDPEVPVDSVARPLFPAQKTVVNTVLRMRREQGWDGALVLGEIGSGKTGVALAVSAELGMKRTLVMCPPHLLTSWTNEAAAVLPGHKVVVLDSIGDAERFATDEGPVIGLLSRERAKLGHGWKGLSGACPRCGGKVPAGDHGSKRTRCDRFALVARNGVAAWLLKHGQALSLLVPDHALARAVFGETAHGERVLRSALEHVARDPNSWEGAPEAMLRELLGEANLPPEALRWVAWACPALATAAAAHRIDGYDEDIVRKAILLAVPPGTDLPKPERSTSLWGGGHVRWADWDAHHALVHGLDGAKAHFEFKDYAAGTFRGVAVASRQALSRALDAVLAAADLRRRTCGEPLFHATPTPARYPLATWLCHRRRDAYDMLIVDECHELSSADSAQSHAKERLEQGGAFRLLLTGSFTNGYADSAYNNMASVSSGFRAEFGRDGRTQFVDRYGYWKRIVQEKDKEGKIVTFGSNSDRVERTAKKAGMAPGVLPLFNLEWLLPSAATLQKTDLHMDLPKPTTAVSPVEMLDEQATNYRHLLNEVLAEIKRTRYVAGLAGKLWGAFEHLAGYPDLAACGDYEIRWPENVPDVGGQVVAKVPGMDPKVVLPKERWMLNVLRSEVESGRPVLVLAWHRALLARLLRVLAAEGFDDAIYLDASEVPTAKRQTWISQQVVKPKRSVMVVNPVAIQTGLNNLVHFKTQLWMENPQCNPHVYRQAMGRIDRIGQTAPPHFDFGLYEKTLQEQAHKLLLHKVGVALGVDGLDPEAALRAAGVADEGFLGLSVGRTLYRMLTGE